MTEQDDGVPQMEEKQDINVDVGITIIDSPSTSAFSLVEAADPTTATFSTPTSSDDCGGYTNIYGYTTTCQD
jgi:hypothetical protein